MKARSRHPLHPKMISPVLSFFIAFFRVQVFFNIVVCIFYSKILLIKENLLYD